MSIFTSILTGAKPGPRRMLVYGTAGIGKSTFATCAPSPIVIQTEDGLGEIDCHKFPVAQSFTEVMNALAALYQEDHRYRTGAPHPCRGLQEPAGPDHRGHWLW
jgi:hypothetical protein